MSVKRYKERKKWMKRIAGVLAVGLVLGEMPGGTVWASQVEESKMETESERSDIGENEVQTVSEDSAVAEKVTDEEAELDYVFGRELTDEEIEAQMALEPAYLPELEVFELPEKEIFESGSAGQIGLNSIFSETLEESYDVRDSGIYNEIENQYNWGTCWAFSALDLLESSLIQKEKTKQGAMNLSERHLAYFVGFTGGDLLGNAAEDTISSSPETYYLSRGGNFYYAAMKLMNWHGGAAESEYEYVSDNDVPALQTESAQDAIAHIENCYWIATEPNNADTIQAVKTLVKQYGGVTWSYYHDKAFLNYSTSAYYNYVNQKTNHAIVIVGWDDTYSKENFGTEGDSTTQPENDGAWIVRNSWGSSWGDEGYLYISYEDTSLGSGNGAAVMTANLSDDYDNNYFYGNTVAYKYKGGFSKAAQVYRIKGKNAEQEQIRGISFMLASTDTEYSIQIYKNPELEEGVVTNPESGEAMLETPVTGTTSYAGLYTIELPEPVTLTTDDYAAIVITFPNADEYVYMDASDTFEGTGVWTNTNVTAPGQSLYGSSTWTDLHNSGYSFRINMLTDDVEEEGTIPVINGITITEPDGFEAQVLYKIRWSKCTDATEYEIYRSVSEDGTYTKIGNVGADERYYSDGIEKADWSTGYYYKVRAVFADSTWAESEPAAAQAEGVLRTTLSAVSYSKEQVTISWKAVGDAAGYRIERREKGETEYQQIADITEQAVTSYVDDISELALGYYEYRVQAYSETEAAEWSEGKTAVKNLAVTPVSSGKIKYEWLPVEDAYKYTMCVVTKDSSYKYTNKWSLYASNIGENTAYTLTISGAKNFKVGDTLEFFVRTYDADEQLISTTQSAYCYTRPDALTVESSYSDGKIKFLWTGGEGADAVYIYRSMEENMQSAEPYAVITDTEVTEFEDDDVSDVGTYYYWFYPGVTNSSGEVVYGEAFTCLQSVLQTVGITEITKQDEKSLLIAWKPVEEAEYYSVYRSEKKNGEYAAIAENVTISEYVDSTVITGKTYYYKVTYHVKDEQSILQDTAYREGKTLPDAPVLSSVSYNRVVIKNNPSFSYGIGEEGCEAVELLYQNSDEEELAFTGLVPERNYVVYARTRQEITGEEPVYGEALQITAPEYPIAKTDELSAVCEEVKVEACYLNENSTYSLQIQNQRGELLDTELFSFTSANSKICMVSQDGVVSANPEFTGKTDTRVKITATAEDDPEGRQVEFYVTVLSKKYINDLEIENITGSGNGLQNEKIDTFFGQKFVKGSKLTLAAAAYDVNGTKLESPQLEWKISDSSIAFLKKNKDGTVTVTWKKAGRVKLTCKSKDEWQKTKAIQLGALTTEPVISTKQVTLNKKAAAAYGRKSSEVFTVSAKNGAAAKVPVITEIKSGNRIITAGTGAEYFRVTAEENGSYCISVDETFLDKVKNNTVYTITMQTEIDGIPEMGISEPVTENFKIKLKITSKEPAVTVNAAQIYRSYVQKEALTGLLTIKAPGTVTNVRVLTEEEGQINNFGQYFSVEEKEGQWYLQFQDTDGLYNKQSISGKLEITVNGYSTVIKKVTVKTPLLTVKAGNPVLNRQTPGEKAQTLLQANYANVKVLPVEEWQIYAYNKATGKYELQENGEKNSFSFSYDEGNGTLNVGFSSESDMAAKGSYKFKISHFMEGAEELSKELTVKVIDKAPAVKIKTTGKLDLLKRADSTLTGKITLKNISSEVVSVTALNEEKSGANEYYQAVITSKNEFRVMLTEAGVEAPFTTKKVTLPIEVRLEGGLCIQTSMTFKPVQATPAVKVPATETLYKSVAGDYVVYDLTTGQTSGTKIKRIDILSVSEDMEVTVEGGTLTVKLSDRSIKRGTYKIKVNIYFEGAQAIAGSSDGKPLTKTVKVKVAE